MIFSILIILIVGVIGYFYYVQGLFTGLLSAVAGVVGATLAVGYHENLTAALFTSKLTNTGSAVSLVMIFAISFVVIRLVLDAAVPGNIRLPALADKIGGAVMGAILGIFATGVLAIAAQTMPFGPGVFGYTRAKTQGSRDVIVPSARQSLDASVSDELVSEKLDDPENHQSLLLPVDDWVIGLVSHLSDGGSVAGDRTFASVHPAYLDELFGDRIGIQPGADHVAINVPGKENVTVPLAFMPAALAKADSEIKQLRGQTLRMMQSPMLTTDAGNAIVVVRVMFGLGTSDEDKLVRFSTGAIRLVANGVNYYALGTLDDDGTLRINKPDDPLFVNVSDKDHGADLVFFVPRAVSAGILQAATEGPAVRGQKAAAPTGAEFQQHVFLEVKRLARVDLSGLKIGENRAADGSTNVLRKEGIEKPAANVKLPTAAAAPEKNHVAAASSGMFDSGTPASPFEFDSVKLSTALFHSIAMGALDGDPATAAFTAGSAEVRGKKIAKLAVNPVVPLSQIGEGDNAISELFVPPGMKLVQVFGSPPAKTDNPWVWAEHLSDFTLTDAGDKPYKPSGAIAKVTKASQQMMVGAYDADTGVAAVARTPDARPLDVYLLFLVPDGTTMKELDFQGKRVAPINQSVNGG